MMRKNYRKKKFNKKRKSTYKIFFLILVGMTVGFAAINTTLQLIGTLNISRTTWDIHFENPTKTGGVNATKEVALKENDNTTVEYQVKLTNPGDYYEFTVDAKNDGTIDGMITNISNKVYENNVEVNPTYLESTITYSDGKTIENNHLLAAGRKETYKVKVQYKTGLAADQLPDQEKTYNFRFTVTYMQADENATPVRFDFETASWDDIITAYQNNPQDLQQSMENCTTKEVELDLDNDGTAETTAHLRIANISTPSECSTQGFSQTACGLVLEFADTITRHRMNPYVSGDTTTVGANTKGGWEYSDMRAYLNSTTYAYENIDYSTSGIYNALPSELKNKIIDTRVVSGHNSNDTTNFTTTDKLYLLSPHEVFEDDDGDISEGMDYWDTSYNNTRQLDYYKAKGVTSSAYSGAIKKNLSGSKYYWWLRSAFSDSSEDFFFVNGNGDWADINITSNPLEVSPAFRIA